MTTSFTSHFRSLFLVEVDGGKVIIKPTMGSQLLVMTANRFFKTNLMAKSFYGNNGAWKDENGHLITNGLLIQMLDYLSDQAYAIEKIAG